MSEQPTQGKRPAPEAAAQTGQSNGKHALDTLASQIEYFEALAGAEEEPVSGPSPKRASKVHSLTQNTTHRKIR